MKRVAIHIQGIVQGVGFRPFVYRLATERRLDGWVNNAGDGVHIEAGGEPAVLEDFVAAIEAEAPPAARIDSCTVRVLADTADDVSGAAAGAAADVAADDVSGAAPDPVAGGMVKGFRILPSAVDSAASTLVSPDIATCPDCLRELFDPADRRYLYPFINCTNCGPRFTIIDALPYDRPRTSMAEFAMCPDCAAEYSDPAKRRFHAQPNACFDCGPALSLLEQGQTLRADGRLSSQALIRRVADLLQAGRIVALKGLGGYHLACDATNETAVSELRRRKQRNAKP
ncbi:MAG: acylphosphatase, partial [Coriobacteriales bacterium]|nr:acylphosphatase [Coriobacteriales bacterium]